MPTGSEHLIRAQHNLAFAKTFDLKTTPYIDWVVAAYFYAALHLVDAILAIKEDLHPDNHEIRKAYVREKAYLRGIKHEYRELKDRSEDARYRLFTFTSAKVETLIIPLYNSIEQHIRQQIMP